MKNSNLFKRILTCIVGIPLLAVIIYKIPQNNYIGTRILITFAALLGSIEMSKMIFSKITLLSLLTWLLPFLCFFKTEYSDLFFSLLIILALAQEIKTGENDNFNQSISNMGKKLLLIVYPSYLLTYPIRFTALEITNSYLISYYLVLVFGNDIFAYVFGMLFGKNNNAGLKASPKKSYAGFAGGFISSIIISLVYASIFRSESSLFSNYAFIIITPMVLSVFADIGDLAESVIKRCANVKDSSHLIPGHGGVLDRLDSIVATVPVFYFIVRILA